MLSYIISNAYTELANIILWISKNRSVYHCSNKAVILNLMLFLTKDLINLIILTKNDGPWGPSSLKTMTSFHYQIECRHIPLSAKANHLWNILPTVSKGLQTVEWKTVSMEIFHKNKFKTLTIPIFILWEFQGTQSTIQNCFWISQSSNCHILVNRICIPASLPSIYFDSDIKTLT